MVLLRYSELPLNGHLSKTLLLTNAACIIYYFLLKTLSNTDISLRQAVRTGPVGVHLRESSLYVIHKNILILL